MNDEPMSLPEATEECELQSERGQATAEYALVIIGAATIATLLIAWAASTGTIGRLLDAVLDSVIGRIA